MLLVIKMGGSILKEGTSSELVSDLKTLAKEHKLVLVHGGGAEVTETAAKLGKEQQFIVSPQGFRSRYTDKETMEIFTMVMSGKINKKLVSALQKQQIPVVDSKYLIFYDVGDFDIFHPSLLPYGYHMTSGKYQSYTFFSEAVSLLG